MLCTGDSCYAFLMAKVVKEKDDAVSSQYEAEIDLRTAMGFDPSEGCTCLSKGAALKRARGAALPNEDLIDLLEDLESGTEIRVNPMVDSTKDPAEIFFEMRIIPPKE